MSAISEEPAARNDIDVRSAIVALRNSQEYHQLQQYYGAQTLLTRLLRRHETRHSDFLAWLLDPTLEHNLGDYPLRKFLETLVIVLLQTRQKERVGQLFPVELMDSIVAGNYAISAVSVAREKPADQKRMDIFILLDFAATVLGNAIKRTFCIIVENKVGTAEHDSQTAHYWAWANANKCALAARGKPSTPPAEDVNVIGVFLSPIPEEDLKEESKADCDCDHYIWIGYQSLVDNMLEPALKKDLSPETRSLLDQYIRTLSYPMSADETSNGDENRRDRGGATVMAIGEKERQLLQDFWTAHENLLVAVMDALSKSKDAPNELRQKAAGFVAEAKSNKDYSPYTISMDGKIMAQDVTKANIGREVVRVLIQAGISESDFQLLRKDKSCGFQLVKQESEITESERKKNRYRLNSADPVLFQGVTYHVVSNWGENNIPRFKKFLARTFPRIELSKQAAPGAQAQ